MSEVLELDGVEEYCEGMEVILVKTSGRYDGKDRKEVGKGSLAIKALNEAGYNSTEIDLDQLLDWVNNNKEKIEEFRGK